MRLIQGSHIEAKLCPHSLVLGLVTLQETLGSWQLLLENGLNADTSETLNFIHSCIGQNITTSMFRLSIYHVPSPQEYKPEKTQYCWLRKV